MKISDHYKPKIIALHLALLLVITLINSITLTSTRDVVISSFLLLVIIVVYAVFIQYNLLGPLHRLYVYARTMRYGKEPQLVEIKKTSALYNLAHEFKKLYLALQQAQNNLSQAELLVEKKVERRTLWLEQALRNLRKSADMDYLTGLANRRYFKHQAQVVFDQKDIEQTNIACLMIDVDNFKAVNDTWGHAAGDDIIVFVAELLRACTREEDVCARYGGDEFVVLLADSDKQQACNVADRLRKHFAREVEKLIPNEQSDSPDTAVISHELNKNNLPCLSIGIATVQGNKAVEINQLMKMADEALYQAKNSGKNCVVAR